MEFNSLGNTLIRNVNMGGVSTYVVDNKILLIFFGYLIAKQIVSDYQNRVCILFIDSLIFVLQYTFSIITRN